jgi:THO complex subunit 2
MPLTLSTTECASVQLKHKLGQILHRECFYPRAIFSMSDATFVAQIGLHLHKKRVPNFSLLIFYDKVCHIGLLYFACTETDILDQQFFGDALPSCIFSCSEAQATNLGRCLGLMLKDIEVWRASKTTYNEQALGSKNEETGQYEYQGMRLFNNEYLTWEKWGNMVYKWHKKILKVRLSPSRTGDNIITDPAEFRP